MIWFIEETVRLVSYFSKEKICIEVMLYEEYLRYLILGFIAKAVGVLKTDVSYIFF